MEPLTPSSELSPSIEILTADETTDVISAEEAGAEILLDRLGPYELGERIGQGGMAVVYRAKVVGPFGFEKRVVVKRLQPALTTRPEFFELFTQEARITAQLGHPGIVQVHDFGIAGGAPFLVMEYLDGVNLAQIVRQLGDERIPVEVAVIIVTQVCHALGYAHGFRDLSGARRQVIHGDVSPSNIMVCRDGTTKLLDFGVAKLLGEFDFELPPNLTGKSAYMAPEQLRREPFDRRVDVFAAGIVLHELLAGRRLFAAQNDAETLHRVLETRVLPPSHWNRAVPPALDRLALRALQPDPGARFESGEEMARALEAACRIPSGRKRVADFVERLFAGPDPGDLVDGTQLTALEPSPPRLPPPPPLPLRAVASPYQPRPRSVTMAVAPLSPQRPTLRRIVAPAVAIGLAGFALAFWLPMALRAPRRIAPPGNPRAHRSLLVPMLTRPPVTAPPRVEPRTVVPPPIVADPVVAPAVIAAPEPHHKKRQPLKQAESAPKRAEPAPSNAEPPALPPPQPAPVSRPRVKDGRLLDPFGATP